MGIEENKEVVRRYYLVFDDEFHQQVQQAEDQDAERERLLRIHRSKCLASDVVIHSSRGDIQSFEDSIQQVLTWINAMPDITFQIEDMIAAGDKVVTRYSARATFTRDYGPYPPTGKEFKLINGITISKVSNGKIIELWGASDSFSFMQQLGAIPTN